MSKILYTTDGIILLRGENIEYGLWEESNDRCKWRARDENGKVIMYALDTNMTAETEEECTLNLATVELPEDYGTSEYLYVDENFVKIEVPPTQEERISALEAMIDEMASAIIEGVNEV